MEQTAMQELFNNLESIDIKVPVGVKKIFLEKEKEQIIDAFVDSRILSITNNCNNGKQYYNETFKQD